MKYGQNFKQSVIANYYQSGMSINQFSSRVGINRETLYHWPENVPSAEISKRSDVFLDKDIFSRKIIGWEVHYNECSITASDPL